MNVSSPAATATSAACSSTTSSSRRDSVRVLDIDPTGTQPEGVELVVADIRDAAAVRAATAGIDVVYHYVAQVPLGRDPAACCARSTSTARRPCSTRAAAAGVGKVVHTVVERRVRRPRVQPGAARHGPPARRSPTAHAKLAAEWACLRAAAGGLDVTIVRPRTILGHGRLGIFAILFDWIADGADPFVLGDGSNRYQFVHADDLADAVRAAPPARPGPAIFNAGTDRFGTMREALEHLCAHAGTGARGALAARCARRPRRCGPTARLGLTPFAPYHWLMYAAVDVVRHRPRPRRAGLAAALLQRRDARRELRLVRRQPWRDRPRAASASPHRRRRRRR